MSRAHNENAYHAPQYMVASGVSPERPDHAQAALLMALDFHSAASTVRSAAAGAPLQLRVGIHTGPVRGGVIGNVRARFCLFGDSVNTASRMETTGDPGTIQLSEETLVVLGLDRSHFERKVRRVGGKGDMVTYTLRPGTEAEAAVRRLLEPMIAAKQQGGGGAAVAAAAASPGAEEGTGGRRTTADSTNSGFGFGGFGGGLARLKTAASGPVPFASWGETPRGGSVSARKSFSGAPPHGIAGAAAAADRGGGGFGPTPRRVTDTSFFPHQSGETPVAPFAELRTAASNATTTSSGGGGAVATAAFAVAAAAKHHQSGIVNESMDLLQEKTLDMLAIAVVQGGLPTFVYVPFPFFLVSCCGCG